MNLAQAEKKLAKAYTQAGGSNATAMPWADIIAIFLEIFKNCTATDAKSFGKSHPLALEFLFGRQLNKIDLAASAKERKIIAKAGVTSFNSTSSRDLDGLRDAA